ncbi:uncharacterized protein LOC131162682 isoform X2 [Malania oleifera]|uniref:uncharacterized protein LOC131162682 isoform X2 n=1 Tax=Malania oleifera TaxID=397392 RepID=UPI0025AEC2B8|nr:uncharacterized protein LOC131162682 isoform X2 [Malania oleifera]
MHLFGCSFGFRPPFVQVVSSLELRLPPCRSQKIPWICLAQYAGPYLQILEGTTRSSSSRICWLKRSRLHRRNLLIVGRDSAMHILMLTYIRGGYNLMLARIQEGTLLYSSSY